MSLSFSTVIPALDIEAFTLKRHFFAPPTQRQVDAEHTPASMQKSRVYNYSSIGEAFRLIYAKEGVKGLTCGLLPTLLRDAPFSGLYLMMYTCTKDSLPSELINSPSLGPYLRFSCGLLAGVGASLVTQPADVIKTKMQLYPQKFKTFPPVLAYVYQKYGIRGYFKGIVPRALRRTLVAAMSWTVYEQVMLNVGLK